MQTCEDGRNSVESRRQVGDERNKINRYYQHWGVVFEVSPKPMVIHFTTPTDNGGLRLSAISSAKGVNVKGPKGDAEIRIDELESFDREIRVNNQKDKSVDALPSNETVEYMRGILYDPSRNGKYNLFFNNCEHFVNCVRYKSKQSDQVKGFFGGSDDDSDDDL